MASRKQIAWRKKFARLYGRKKKSRSGKPRIRKTRRVKATARRRSYRAPRRRYRRSKGGINISLLSLAHYTVQFSNITGQELGATVTALINSIMAGDDSFLDVILQTVNNAINNVTKNPIGVAVKGAIVALVFTELKKMAGHKKLIKVGKFSISV